MMELLNLDDHDPEEYEGKTVMWNDSRYLVGHRIGYGAEKIVHKLINEQSGLSLHVIKIRRVPDPDERMDLAGSPPHEQARFFESGVIPWSVSLSGHGGWGMVISKSLSTAPLGMDPVCEELVDKADDAASAKAFAEAISLYAAILERNPYHTHALHNLGVILHQQADRTAGGFLAKAISIEPNFPDYYLTLVRCLVSWGMYYEAIAYYEESKRRFPFECAVDYLAVGVYLECGLVDKAQLCAEMAYVLTEAQMKNVEAAIAKAHSERRQAKLLLEKSAAGQSDYDLALLEKAFTICSVDLYLSMNYAFALMRNNHPEQAKQVLVTRLHKHGKFIDRLCMVNVAFCDIMSRNYPEAVQFFEVVWRSLKEECDGEKLSFADLPSFGVYLSDVSGNSAVIENPQIGRDLLIHLIEVYNTDSESRETLEQLGKLYGEAVESRRMQDGNRD